MKLTAMQALALYRQIHKYALTVLKSARLLSRQCGTRRRCRRWILFRRNCCPSCLRRIIVGSSFISPMAISCGIRYLEACFGSFGKNRPLHGPD